MDTSKKMGIIIATGMPPPNKLKRSMMGPGSKDEGESDQEAQDETDSGESGGGVDALKSMYDAWKSGDNTAAWDAFCDAVDIAKSRGKSGDSGSSDNSGGSDNNY